MVENVSILFVDDNVNLTKTFEFILKRKEVNIDVAQDGLKAIDMVKDKFYEIIFIDIRMPIMNGVETLKRIKKIQPNSSVIMMTAYSVDELIQEALNEGAYDILYKPIEIESILTIIVEALEEKTGGLVLVVDDDYGFSSSLERILTMKGYKVGLAQTGEDAINLVQKNSYDIVLIDLKLPTINGLELLMKIKELNSKIEAIMITGFIKEMSELAKKAVLQNAYTYLYKPLDIIFLLELIKKILKLKRKEITENIK